MSAYVYAYAIAKTNLKGTLSQRFCFSFRQNNALVPLLVHEMLLEHHDEDIK